MFHNVFRYLPFLARTLDCVRRFTLTTSRYVGEYPSVSSWTNAGSSPWGLHPEANKAGPSQSIAFGSTSDADILVMNRYHESYHA